MTFSKSKTNRFLKSGVYKIKGGTWPKGYVGQTSKNLKQELENVKHNNSMGDNFEFLQKWSLLEYRHNSNNQLEINISLKVENIFSVLRFSYLERIFI